jgi:hypothetical protein
MESIRKSKLGGKIECINRDLLTVVYPDFSGRASARDRVELKKTLVPRFQALIEGLMMDTYGEIDTSYRWLITLFNSIDDTLKDVRTKKDASIPFLHSCLGVALTQRAFFHPAFIPPHPSFDELLVKSLTPLTIW